MYATYWWRILQTAIIFTWPFLAESEAQTPSSYLEAMTPAVLEELLDSTFPVSLSVQEKELIAKCSGSESVSNWNQKQVKNARREAKLHKKFGGRIWLIAGAAFALEARRAFLVEMVSNHRIKVPEEVTESQFIETLVPKITGQGRDYWPQIERFNDVLHIDCFQSGSEITINLWS